MNNTGRPAGMTRISLIRFRCIITAISLSPTFIDLTGNTKDTQQKLGTANFFWSMESLTEVLHSFFSVRLVWQSVVQFRCVSLLSCLLSCLLTLLFCNQPFVVSELIKRNVYLFQNKELNFHCTTKLLVNM